MLITYANGLEIGAMINPVRSAVLPAFAVKLLNSEFKLVEVLDHPKQHLI